MTTPTTVWPPASSASPRIGEASSVLSWDAAAMMPPGGGAARGDQLAVLAGLAHALLIAPEVADDLAAAEAAGETDPWRAANLRLMRHAHTRATAMPADLVEAQARANSNCEKVWREARRRSDFDMVRPHLRGGGASGARGRRGAGVGARPRPLRRADGRLPARHAHRRCRRDLRRLRDVPAPRPAGGRRAPGTCPATGAAPGPFQIDAQETLCRRLAERLGLDFDHARLDRSAHPFSGGTPSDVRITTRYDEADFTQAMLAVVHETGHALYERGLPAPWARQPVGEAAGMAAHESQSLIVEMQACRSDAFLDWLGPNCTRPSAATRRPISRRTWRGCGDGWSAA